MRIILIFYPEPKINDNLIELGFIHLMINLNCESGTILETWMSGFRSKCLSYVTTCIAETQISSIIPSSIQISIQSFVNSTLYF